MKTKKILAGALAAAVVATSLPGMGVPVFAQTEYGTTLFENRYTDTKPFAFPTEENATATLEAELATSLNNDDTGDRPDQNHYYPMKMVLDDDGVTAIHDMASGGRDYATYAYTAEAGLYEVVANCQCGSTNTMVLSEANNKISKVTVEVAETRDNQRNLIWGTSNKFLLWVNESGAGTLRINSADNQAAPRIDCLTITKVKSPYYVGENRFQFPTDSSSVTLEAEYGILTNVTNSADTNGRWPAMVSPASWASKGYFVNSVNTGDSVAYAYHAEKPGIYEFTATYRSGSEKNHYTWSSTNNKIVAGSVQAGHGNANETQTKTFKVVVKEAFFCVDSDDYLTDNAVEEIYKILPNIKEKRIAGIVALRGTDKNLPIGTQMPRKIRNSSLKELYEVYGFKGDTALIYKTCILKKYPFKIVENEKFIGENYVYDQIDEKYKMFLMNKIIYICSYLPDGYTKNTINLLKKNPYSYMVMKKQSSRISRKMRYKIKHMAGYIAMGLLKKEKKLIRKSGNPIIAIISYPVGILIYFVRFRE